MNYVQRLTLYELNRLVRRSIEAVMADEYWVEAELSDVRESHGHCYMELIQKDEDSATPIARASAKCWRQTWAVARPYFMRTTGQTLRAGMKVLLKVYPQFHEAYGFSWIVTDIDPTYTLGDMARKRQEIIRQLKAEGVFDLNKQLPMPMFAQRIAVVSSETAAGYGDFCAHLADNEHGFKFTLRLFPSIMQGEQVEQSIVKALNAINNDVDNFDCVVIIRGGGATSDISGFDTLTLAENVANFPLPIITGIGHDRDECVLDMVSHTRVKTPTAAAALLINNLKSVADALDTAANAIAMTATGRMDREKLRLGNVSTRIPILFSTVKTRHDGLLLLLNSRLSAATKQRMANERHRMDTAKTRIPTLVAAKLSAARHALELLEQRANALNPYLLLRRGYSVTLYKGKPVRNATALKAGEEVETIVEKGKFKSIIQ